MYKIYTTNRFEKDLKLCKKRNFNLQMIKEVIDLLQANGKLPSNFKPHKLRGKLRRLLGMPHQIGLVVDLETKRP